MRKTFAVVVVSLATAAAGLVGPGPAAGADPDGGVDVAAPVRIMLAGDSITHGFDGDFTWRYRLFQEFGRQGVPLDFVGPRRYPYGGHEVYLADGWDMDHDALGGSLLRGSVGSIGADVVGYQPDVLVAEYGTNDLIQGDTAAELLASWRAYIANARAARPDLKIVVAEVATPKAAARSAANAGLHALAAELSTEESPIVVADLDSPAWIPSQHTRDLVHPNPTGETIIAQRMAEALEALGALPGAPEVARAFVPWTPPLQPAVRSHGRRLVISWTQTRKLYRVHAVRVRVTRLGSGRSMTRSFHWKPTRMETPRLQPGRYRVVLRGSRGTTRSQWGVPVVRRVG